MQMAPQQLSGGPKYSSRTLIGNWSEEVSLEKAKIDDFKHKISSGSSNLRKQQTKIAKCTAKTSLCYAPDGALRFGDAIMLGHLESATSLACDPFIDNIPGKGVFRVSASVDANEPVTRNTFIISRPPSSQKGIVDDEEDPILKIGQAFCLSCHESLLVSPESRIMEPRLFLCSTKKTERTSTKSTNRQMVYMSANNDADSIWMLMPPSHGKKGSSERFLSIGSPVIASEQFLLIHRQTNNYLTVDPKTSERSEFGVDFECFCDRKSEFGKLSVVVREFKGVCTGESLTKPDSPMYSWVLITSLDEYAAPKEDRRASSAVPASIEVLLDEVRQVARSKGSEGFSSLRLLFIILDMKSRVNDGKIDREDVGDCLSKWGLPLDGRYLNMLLSSHDNGNGLINYREYIDFLRGPMSERKLGVLNSVYTDLERVSGGSLTHEGFQNAFVAENHPLVYGGVCSESELKRYFLDSLRFRERMPDTVSLISFVDFFADILYGYDDDAYENSLRSMFLMSITE